MHGIGLYIFISDCDLSISSDYTLECMTLALGYTKERLARLGKSIPEHLHVQLDNTVSQNKNSIVLKAMVAMTALRMWASASLGFLRVGHTHEDVGEQEQTSVN